MYDYTGSANKATELLTKYGATVEVINTSKSVLSTGAAVRGSLTKNNLPASLTENADAIFYIEQKVSGLEQKNFLRSGGVIYKITAVEPVQPANDLLLYMVVVSR